MSYATQFTALKMLVATCSLSRWYEILGYKIEMVITVPYFPTSVCTPDAETMFNIYTCMKGEYGECGQDI
jgi:hypothetical protein